MVVCGSNQETWMLLHQVSVTNLYQNERQIFVNHGRMLYVIFLLTYRCKRHSGSKGMMGSQSTKSGTKMKKSTFHKRSCQQLTQIENWASHWSLLLDPPQHISSTSTNILNGPIKSEAQQGLSNQHAATRCNSKQVFQNETKIIDNQRQNRAISIISVTVSVVLTTAI